MIRDVILFDLITISNSYWRFVWRGESVGRVYKPHSQWSSTPSKVSVTSRASTEVWYIQAPDLPILHFHPRQIKLHDEAFGDPAVGSRDDQQQLLSAKAGTSFRSVRGSGSGAVNDNRRNNNVPVTVPGDGNGTNEMGEEIAESHPWIKPTINMVKNPEKKIAWIMSSRPEPLNDAKCW